MTMKNLKEAARRWLPVGGQGRMNRPVFWGGFLLLCAVGAAISLRVLAYPSHSGEIVLIVWTAVFLVFVCPAIVRRERDANVPLWLSLLLLIPLVFIALAALFVPPIGFGGVTQSAAAATYTICLFYPVTLVVFVVPFCLLPSKHAQ